MSCKSTSNTKGKAKVSKSQKKRAAAAKAQVRFNRRNRLEKFSKSLSKALNVDHKILKAAFSESGIIHLLEEVEDYRDPSKITYDLADLLALVFLSIARRGSCEFEAIADHIEVNKDYYEELGLIHDGQVPSHDTFRTVFCNLDPISFRIKTVFALYSLLRRVEMPDGKMIHWALDGKDIRGTGRAKNTLHPARNISSMNLFDVTHKVNILADPIDTKTNEIPVAEDIVQLLDIKNIILTADAIQTKSLLCDLINFKGGFYVFPVKDARTTLYKTVQGYLENPDFQQLCQEKILNDRVFEIFELRDDQNIPGFSSTKVLVKMTSYTRGGKEKPKVMYFISNLTDTDQVLDAICSRWAIENEHHKLKDSPVINEDKIRFRDETALRNMTVMTDLMALLIQMYRVLEPGMRLKIAKLNIQDRTLESMLRVLNALGDEEFVRRLREDKPQPARRKRRSNVSKDSG